VQPLGEAPVLVSVLNYLLYFSVTLGLLVVAGVVYVRFTPGNEIALIREGNAAAAVALSGAMLGYAAVVYSATAHGGTIIETALWSVVALVVQIAACEVVCFVIHDKWKAEIARGDMAHGIMLGAFSLAAGLINAGCLTP
jgi:putative membrane protein